MFSDKSNGRGVSFRGYLCINSSQPMLAASNAEQAMLNTVFLQLGGHHDRLLVRHVGVDLAVDQQRGWIVGRDVPHRHERHELVRFVMWVPARDGFGPQPLLTTELIEGSPVAFS